MACGLYYPCRRRYRLRRRLFLCLVLGIVPTAIFVSVMSGLCCYEFFRMTRLDGKMANERMGIAAAVLRRDGQVLRHRVGAGYRSSARLGLNVCLDYVQSISILLSRR